MQPDEILGKRKKIESEYLKIKLIMEMLIEMIMQFISYDPQQTETKIKTHTTML